MDKEIPPQTRTLEIPREDLTTGATFAGRYKVIEELGKGGMGKVFKVLDQKLNEEVALKLIRPELALDRKALERFSSELRMARKIVHKNVGRVYELMEDHGVHFITMEYVKGQDLKDLIRQTGQLTIGKAIFIAKQVCEGLAEAHRSGIVHRDLKPGNIMIDKDGDARIMDFGIARSVHARSLTGEGVIIGTPDYMSPEQVEGKEVDQRSDIYSLGIILYEMVTGRVPFTGDTPLTVAVKHKTEIPQDPAELNPLVPENLAQIVLKCLEKAREDRFQSAEELRLALTGSKESLPAAERALAQTKQTKSKRADAGAGQSRVKKIAFYGGAVAFLALLLYAALNFLGGRKAVIDSIAVLPFENISKNPDLDIYCMGIPDSVREKLSQLKPPRPRIISRGSTITYKDMAVDPKKVGQELGVESLLTGAVSLKANELSIRMELVRTGDGSIIRERTYDRPTAEILTLEDVIFASVIEGLGLALSGKERQESSARPIANVTAYEFYLKAMQLGMTYPEQGIKYLQNALDITGDNAFLYAAMADIGGIQAALFNVSQQDIYLAKGEEYANKALALDPEFPRAHVVLGYIYSQFRGNQLEAVRHFKRALAWNPEDPEALGGLIATYIEYLGRLAEAAPLVGRLKAVDPQNWWNSWNPGGLEFFAGRYDLALDPWRKMLNAYPNAPSLFWYVLALVYNHRLDEAFPLIDQGASEFADSAFVKQGLLLKWALQKNKAAAARVLTPDFEKACKRDADMSRMVGVTMALLGEKEKALDWLQNAVDRGFLNYSFLEKDPFLESLHGEERFKKILEQAKREFEAIPD
ncbi:MAG: protein kinase [Candidatus Aminicenantes bacterium]|nr:protein kinase [Candidatus Aminicenantes bacterium]